MDTYLETVLPLARCRVGFERLARKDEVKLRARLVALAHARVQASDLEVCKCVVREAGRRVGVTSVS